METIVEEQNQGFDESKKLLEALQQTQTESLDMDSLRQRPVLAETQLNEAVAYRNGESHYEHVDVSKIVGRNYIQEGGWAYEYPDREGRMRAVADEIKSGTPENMERVFHDSNPDQRIKLIEIQGPAGPMYSVEDGTHRVGGAMLAGLESMPAMVQGTEYPITAQPESEAERADWQSKLDAGLIQGTFTPDGKLTVESEVLPWIRTSNQNDLMNINQTYEELYPGSLDNLPIPREALTDFVANNYYMAGRWDEYTQRRAA